MVFCLEVKAPDLDWESEEEELVDSATQNCTAAAERKDNKKPWGPRDTVGDHAELEREINDDIAAWFESGLDRKPGPGTAPLVDTRRGSEATLVSCDSEDKETGSSKQEDGAEDSDKTESATAEDVAQTKAASKFDSKSDTIFIPCLTDRLSPASHPFSVFIPTRIPVLPDFSQGELDRILRLIRFGNFMAPRAVGSTDDAAGRGAETPARAAASLAGPEPPPSKPTKENAMHSLASKDSSNGNDGCAREADVRKKKNKKKKKKKAKNAQTTATVAAEADSSFENPTPSIPAKTDNIEAIIEGITTPIPTSEELATSQIESSRPAVEIQPMNSDPIPTSGPKDENGGTNPSTSTSRPKRNNGRRGKGTSKNKISTNPPPAYARQGDGSSDPNSKFLGPPTLDLQKSAGSTPNNKKASHKVFGSSNKTPVLNNKEGGFTSSDSPVYKLNERLDNSKAVNRYSCLGGLVDGSIPDIDSGPAGKRAGRRDSDSGGGSSRKNRRAAGRNSSNAGQPPHVNVHRNTNFTGPPKAEPRAEPLSTAAAPQTSAVIESSPALTTPTDASKMLHPPDDRANPIECPPDASAADNSKDPDTENKPAPKDAVSQDSGCAVTSPSDTLKGEMTNPAPAPAISAPPLLKEEPPKAPASLGWADEVELEKGEVDAPLSSSETVISDGEKGSVGPASGNQQLMASMPPHGPQPGPDCCSGRGQHYYNQRSSYYRNRQQSQMPPQAPAGYSVPSHEWGNRNNSPPHQRNEHRGQYNRRYQHNGGPPQQQHMRRYYQGAGPQQCGPAFPPPSGPVRAGQQIPMGSAPTSPPVVQAPPANPRAHPTGASQPVGIAPPMGQPPTHFQPGPPVGYYNTNMTGAPGPYGGPNVPMHPPMIPGSQFIPHGNYHGGRYNGNRHPRSAGQRYDSYNGGGGRGPHQRSYQRYEQQQQLHHSGRGQHHQRHTGPRGSYASGGNNASMQQQHAVGIPAQEGSGQIAPHQDLRSQQGESTAAPPAASRQAPSVAPSDSAGGTSIPHVANSESPPAKQRIMIVLDCDEENDDSGCGGEGAGYTKLMSRVLAGLQENGIRVVGCSIEDAPDGEVGLTIPQAAQ